MVFARPPSHESFIRGLACDQRDVELALLEQRDILVAALGVARLDRQRRIGRVHDLGEGIAIERKAAAWRRRAERDRRLWNGFVPLLGCGAGR